MKIAVFGVGAMGSVYAGLLADAGHEVWAVDPWQAHLDAIATTGLRVEGASGDRVVKTIRTAADPADLPMVDLVIIATKASAVGEAARALTGCVGPETLILTIQNGLGAGERIGHHMDTANVILGVADGFGASMKGPGHAHHNAMKLIRIGEMGGGMTERLEQLAEVWQGAGFNVKAFADINQLIWEKFLCNVTLSAPCTVIGCTVGEVMDNAETRALALNCMREAYAIGLHKGIDFSFDDPEAYVTAFAAQMPHARPSMLLDHMAGRPSEIDAINGMVPVLGAEIGLPTPYNQTLSTIVRAREAAFGKDKA
ncbi:ketopantoate reductase family protein [Nioella ostreopsis]|uniref:ketopantoate reductase family protein n=1 Tax=Nioella ostreopsis TaxID=2448479 RepID=UPI000FD95DA4|nr:2-dehydropantoate 2-reductase [Nioella ostreopsis]